VSTAPVVVQPVPRGTLAGRVGKRMVDWVPALVVLVVVLVVWQESIEILHIKKFLAPQPTAIASTFWQTATNCSAPAGSPSRRR